MIAYITSELLYNIDMNNVEDNAFQNADELDNITWGIFDKYLTDDYDFYYTNPLTIQCYIQKFHFYLDENVEYKKKVTQFFRELITVLPSDCVIDMSADTKNFKITITKSF